MVGGVRSAARRALDKTIAFAAKAPADPLCALYTGPSQSVSILHGYRRHKLITVGVNGYGRSDLFSLRRSSVRRLWGLCLDPERTLTVVALLYAVAALGVAIYMVAALTRPDKF